MDWKPRSANSNLAFTLEAPQLVPTVARVCSYAGKAQSSLCSKISCTHQLEQTWCLQQVPEFSHHNSPVRQVLTHPEQWKSLGVPI